MTGQRGQLLFVCHANICRSAMAERLARHALAGRLGPGVVELSVASAGTHARADEPMHPRAAAVLRELGADGGEFRSRALSARLVADAGIVLAATRRERAICAALSPPAVGRVFTIRQFGRLAAALGPASLAGVPAEGRLSVLLDEVRAVRGQLQPVSAQVDDLADPVPGSIQDFRACAAQIRGSLDAALAVIMPT